MSGLSTGGLSALQSRSVWCVENGVGWPSFKLCAEELGAANGSYLNQVIDRPNRTFKGFHFVSRPCMKEMVI